ncbi:MAG: peroxiredoxin-like family protein [Parvibaculum sp.]|uniref:peroxiredoxin-like family protein n=1 Tax=Parvibaculum sp. TaxID=2024848 RepID=UPI002ABC10F3|nr:peroxiredoxin-like family protein [Parvibaculum sp.]MDZ4382643.1 peroxiredoxin-like family protein [Parvibaculum sp.]
MSLKELIEEETAKHLTVFPKETQVIMAQAAQELVERGVGKDALREGDRLPAATLLDAHGKEVSLAALVAEGPLVINYYRGAWCPYCNLELRAYQQLLPEIEAAGGRLIAITPELPDHAVTASEENALSFPVLSDVGLKLSEALGISFELPEALKVLYGNFGAALDKLNGEDRWRLPIPATYVVGKDGIIVKAHVDVNYRARMEPGEALEALLALQAKAA